MKNVFLQNLANLNEEQAKVVWEIGKAHKIISEDLSVDTINGKALHDAIGTVQNSVALAKVLGATKGMDGVVQALYGRPVKTSSATARLPARPEPAKVAKPKGRPATGNSSGRYSNEAISPNAYVLVQCANPKRPGTAAHSRFAKYKNGATVSVNTNINGGPRLDDLRWDLKRGHIKLSVEAPATSDVKHDTKTASNGVTLAKKA